ncbi:MAG: nicotinamidase [Conexivisphaerales archaeon]
MVKALIVVDMQNDFMDDGALPVHGSVAIIPAINRYIELFSSKGAKIIATRDWHPENHISFRSRGGLWPPHCIQNTKGAQFHPLLRLAKNTLIVSKATDPDKEAYSGFQGTGLAYSLKSESIDELYVCGVATEYCVKNTALDALAYSFKVHLLTDAIKGIDEEASKVAVQEMVNKGVLKDSLNAVKL